MLNCGFKCSVVLFTNLDISSPLEKIAIVIDSRR